MPNILKDTVRKEI